MTSDLSRTAAAVIHHDNYPEVLETVLAIIRAGIAPERLLVVDNTENEPLFRRLRAGLPARCSAISVPNGGYGHAANLAVQHFRSTSSPPDYLLVATHETKPAPEAVSHLLAALTAEPTAAVAGPTLTVRERGATVVWSQGGRFTRITNEPRHYTEQLRPTSLESSISRDWVDGAFCLYRFDVLSRHPHREDFFLYFEETELHARLRAAGHRVLWVPAASVGQSTAGVPAYLLTRNLQLYQQLHGSALQRRLTVPLVIARRAIKGALFLNPVNVRPFVRGWLDARRGGRLAP